MTREVWLFWNPRGINTVLKLRVSQMKHSPFRAAAKVCPYFLYVRNLEQSLLPYSLHLINSFRDLHHVQQSLSQAEESLVSPHVEASERSYRRLEYSPHPPSVQSNPSTKGIQTHPPGLQRGVLQTPNLPALWFQSAANSSQREKGWRAISRNKLLPEELDIKAKIQCAWETVWVSIHLAYDLGKNESSV